MIGDRQRHDERQRELRAILTAIEEEAERLDLPEPRTTYKDVNISEITVDPDGTCHGVAEAVAAARAAAVRSAVFDRPAPSSQPLFPARRPRPETPEAARFRLALSDRAPDGYKMF